MNKRIQELAEQANTIGDWGEDITEGRYFVYPNIKNLEKFAELIVRKCLTQIKDGMVNKSELLYEHEETTECVNEALMDAHHNIAIHFGFAEHFGVEE